MSWVPPRANSEVHSFGSLKLILNLVKFSEHDNVEICVRDFSTGSGSQPCALLGICE